MKFVASRLSEGNKIFPSEIYLEPTGITIKIPGLFSGETKQFDYNHIASVEIDTPMIGFSTITIFAGGTQMSANGFTKEEAKQIKNGIEKGKLSSNTNPISDTYTGKSNNKGFTEELRKVKELLNDGIITKEEFDTIKKRLLEI